MTSRTRFLGLFMIMGLCLGAGGLGAWATTPEIDGWYRSITKPDWNPPDWIFGPVWTTLYVMMGLAAWMIWKPAGWKPARFPLALFVWQLILNVAWSWIFFNQHQLGWAFAEILVLWAVILATTIAFFRVQQLAGWLMVPYLCWVSFTSLLNFVI